MTKKEDDQNGRRLKLCTVIETPLDDQDFCAVPHCLHGIPRYRDFCRCGSNVIIIKRTALTGPCFKTAFLHLRQNMGLGTISCHPGKELG